MIGSGHRSTRDGDLRVVAHQCIQVIPAPPNKRMELIALKRHGLCREQKALVAARRPFLEH